MDLAGSLAYHPRPSNSERERIRELSRYVDFLFFLLTGRIILTKIDTIVALISSHLRRLPLPLTKPFHRSRRRLEMNNLVLGFYQLISPWQPCRNLVFCAWDVIGHLSQSSMETISISLPKPPVPSHYAMSTNMIRTMEYTWELGLWI